MGELRMPRIWTQLVLGQQMQVVTMQVMNIGTKPALEKCIHSKLKRNIAHTPW